MWGNLFKWLSDSGVVDAVVDTTVRAGVQTIATGQDFEDSFKQQGVLSLGGGLFNQIAGNSIPAPPRTQTASSTASRTVPLPRSSSTAPSSGNVNVPYATPGFNPGAGNPTLQGLMNGSGGVSSPLEILANQASTTAPVEPQDNRGFLESLGDIITGSDDYNRWDSAKQAFFPTNGTPLRKYGPLVGAGILGAYAAGAFDPEEIDPPEFQGGPSGREQMYRRPGMYRPGVPQIARKATGGGISGPGTGTSDDIPALLSDGEFVMTNEAVRGAGDGNREKGMRTMYDIMHNFERRA